VCVCVCYKEICRNIISKYVVRERDAESVSVCGRERVRESNLVCEIERACERKKKKE